MASVSGGVSWVLLILSEAWKPGGAGGATVAPPTKLLGEQLVHLAPPIFSAT